MHRKRELSLTSRRMFRCAFYKQRESTQDLLFPLLLSDASLMRRERDLIFRVPYGKDLSGMVESQERLCATLISGTRDYHIHRAETALQGHEFAQICGLCKYLGRYRRNAVCDKSYTYFSCTLKSGGDCDAFT